MLIDRQSAAPPVSEATLREWAAETRVFVSSVIVGMEKERAAVADAIQTVGAVPVLFERFGGRDDGAERAYLGEVQSAEVYIGLLDEKYGVAGSSGLSATHDEFHEAERAGLRICVWVGPANPREPGTERLIEEVRMYRTTGSYPDEESLKLQVIERLANIAAEVVAPWCKLDQFVFRASEIEDRGEVVVVSARVKDGDIVAGLEHLRPAGFRSSDPTLFTWRNRSRWVKVDQVEARHRSGRSVEVEVVLNTVEARHHLMLDAGTEGFGPDDITELVLRHHLFDEPVPIDELLWPALGPPDPVADLRGEVLAEDQVQPIVSLLLTEGLVGGGRADRVLEVAVGPSYGDARHLRAAWLTRRRYVNVEPERRSIEGAMRI